MAKSKNNSFQSNPFLPVDDLISEDLLMIDMDALNTDSQKEADSMVRIVTDLFYDEKFRQEHPQAARRIEMEMETLRGLIKMRKSDEEAHDALLQAISENKNNASLYRSMAEIQRTSIAISNKIHDTVDRINKTCSDLTVATQMAEPDESEENKPKKAKAHLGTKSFIEEMTKK